MEGYSRFFTEMRFSHDLIPDNHLIFLTKEVKFEDRLFTLHLSSSPEEVSQVETFNLYFTSLYSSGLASLASTDEQPFSDAVGSPTSTFVTGAASSVTGLVTSSGGGVMGFQALLHSLRTFAGSSSSDEGTFGISHASSLTSFALSSSCLFGSPRSSLTNLTFLGTSSEGTSGILRTSSSTTLFDSSFTSFAGLTIPQRVRLKFLTSHQPLLLASHHLSRSILEDLLVVSPLVQSNSEILGPSGTDFRYCESCFLVVISSPVGAVNTVLFLPGVPPFFSKHYMSRAMEGFYIFGHRELPSRIASLLIGNVAQNTPGGVFFVEELDPKTDPSTTSPTSAGNTLKNVKGIFSSEAFVLVKDHIAIGYTIADLEVYDGKHANERVEELVSEPPPIKQTNKWAAATPNKRKKKSKESSDTEDDSGHEEDDNSSDSDANGFAEKKSKRDGKSSKDGGATPANRGRGRPRKA
ncbi:hypothetical protein Tco_0686694 [Tanacetum coccineum]